MVYASDLYVNLWFNNQIGGGVTSAKEDLLGLDATTKNVTGDFRTLSTETRTLGKGLMGVGGTASMVGGMLGGDLGQQVGFVGLGFANLGHLVGYSAAEIKAFSLTMQSSLVVWGIAALALGAVATAAIAVYSSMDKNRSKVKDFEQGITDMKTAADKAKTALKELKDAQDEYAGIPKSLSKLRVERAEAKIAFDEATEEYVKDPTKKNKLARDAAWYRLRDVKGDIKATKTRGIELEEDILPEKGAAATEAWKKTQEPQYFRTPIPLTWTFGGAGSAVDIGGWLARFITSSDYFKSKPAITPAPNTTRPAQMPYPTVPPVITSRTVGNDVVLNITLKDAARIGGDYVIATQGGHI